MTEHLDGVWSNDQAGTDRQTPCDYKNVCVHTRTHNFTTTLQSRFATEQARASLCLRIDCSLQDLASLSSVPKQSFKITSCLSGLRAVNTARHSLPLCLSHPQCETAMEAIEVAEIWKEETRKCRSQDGRILERERRDVEKERRLTFLILLAYRNSDSFRCLVRCVAPAKRGSINTQFAFAFP